MQGITKRRVGGLGIAGLVVAGVAVASSMSASGAELPTGPEATAPALKPFGTLTINLNGQGNTYTLTDPAGGPLEVPNPEYDPDAVDPVDPVDEFITLLPVEIIQVAQPCATIFSGQGELIQLSATAPGSTDNTVQVRDVNQTSFAALGANTGGASCGSSAAAVVAEDEELTIDLGPYFADLKTAGTLDQEVFIASADLKVTQNKKGNLRVALDAPALYPDPDPDSDYIFKAFTIDQSPQIVPIEPEINSVDDLFTSVTVRSDTRKSNEGISIADGTSFNLVTVVDGQKAVDCGEQVTATGGETGDIADSAVFFRLNNKNNAVCEEVAVTVEIVTGGPAVGNEDAPQTDYVYWDNQFDGVQGTPQPGVLGLVTIKWAPVPAADAAKLDRQIDYDGPGGGGAFPTLWCVSFDSEELTAVRPMYDPTPDDGVEDSVEAPWCLVSDTRELIGGEIHQTEVMFGGGDPMKW